MTLQVVEANRIVCKDSRFLSVKGEEPSWLYSSTLNGIRSFVTPLGNDKEGTYEIQMGFIPSPAVKKDQRQFDILINGQKIASNVDVAVESEGLHKPLVKKFIVQSGNDMHIEFISK